MFATSFFDSLVEFLATIVGFLDMIDWKKVLTDVIAGLILLIIGAIARFIYHKKKINLLKRMEEKRIFFMKAHEIKPSILDKKFESPGKYYTLEGATPKYEEVIKTIKNELDSKVGIILVGRSLSGKTRTAFEAMHRMAGFWILKLTQQSDYSTVKKAKRLFKGKKIILFLDDLQDFAKLDRNQEELLQALYAIHDVARKVCILATLRGEEKPDGEIGGEEIDYLKEKGDKLNREIFLKCRCIMLPDLTDEEGQKMAENIGYEWDPENFDGTIGSVVEKIGDMKNKYSNLPENAKGILYSLRALSDARVFFPEKNCVKDVAENVYGCSYVSRSDNSFHNAMDLLCGNGFLFTFKDKVLPRHSIYISDKFLDEYSENINPKIFDQIEELAFTKWRSFASILAFASMWENCGDNDRILRTAERLVELDDKSALAWYVKGLALGKLGDFQGEIECYDKALKIDQKYIYASINKGVALGKLDDYPGAIECYDKTLEIDTKNIKAWFNKGVALGKLGEHQREIECFDKALEIDPKFIAALIGKGIALGELGEYQGEIECYDKALEIDQKVTDAWYNKGVALGKLGEYQGAIECYDKALEIDPKYIKAWYNKGVALGELGKYQRAIECFDKALEIDPKYTDAWFNKGIALGKLGEYQGEIECYDKALEIDPKYIDALINKGLALGELGEHKREIECYDKALEIDPKYIKAWYNKGVTLGQLGDYQGEIECYDKALEIDPKYIYAWHNKGVALAKLGEHQRAIECFDKSLEIDPKYIDAWYNKGTALAELGDYPGAIECFDKALEIDPKYKKAWYNKGVVLGKLGEHQGEIECYDKALEIDPKYINAWYGKGLALLSLGIFEDALLPFSKCIELREDLYGYIFSYLIQRNRNREFQELVNEALKCKQTDWPYQVLEYFAGKITEQELIILAGSDPQKTCEVHCYIGYIYKFTGDNGKAREHFQVSIKTNQKELIEYKLSQLELDKLN